MNWAVKLGIIGSVASIISFVMPILGRPRIQSTRAKWIIGLSVLFGAGFCYIAVSQYHSVLDVEFTAAAGSLDLQTFLKELSLGEATVGIEPSVASDLGRKKVKIDVPALKNAPLKYVLDNVLIPQLPGPEQWTYEVVGKTIMIKRGGRK